MAWTPPMTAVANEIFTAAQFNVHVRDNLLETAPAKAANTGSYFAVDGTNSISERTPDTDVDDNTGTISSTSYGDLSGTDPGPSISLTTGSKALIHWGAQMQNDTAGAFIIVAPEVSGATSSAASDSLSYSMQQPTAGDDFSFGRSYMYTSLTAGTNTFSLKYRVTSGTGTYLRRWIVVLPF